MLLVYNSDLLNEADFRLSADDRAFQYGDGLFETIRYESGHIWFWPDHFERLTAGMHALHLALPINFSAQTLLETILNLVAANGLARQSARVKIQVWRQTGGLYTPTTNESNVVITARAGQPYSITSTAKVGIYHRIALTHSPISAYKLVNAIPYVLAGIYKRENGFSDVLLLDQAGHLAEAQAANLFWFQNDRLHTPSLRTGCINGIARRNLLRAFPDAVEGMFLPGVLAGADLVFAANVMGVQVHQGVLTELVRTRLLSIFTDTSLPTTGSHPY